VLERHKLIATWVAINAPPRPKPMAPTHFFVSPESISWCASTSVIVLEPEASPNPGALVTSL
jgi:hypothetical protein